MEKNNDSMAKHVAPGFGEKKMTRKEAIKTTGFIAASAATMLVLLSNPAKAGGRGHTCSPSGDQHGGDDYRNHQNNNNNNNNNGNNNNNNGGWRR